MEAHKRDYLEAKDKFRELDQEWQQWLRVPDLSSDDLVKLQSIGQFVINGKILMRQEEASRDSNPDYFSGLQVISEGLHKVIKEIEKLLPQKNETRVIIAETERENGRRNHWKR